MKPVTIVLICPQCGNSIWSPLNDTGEYECLACKEICCIENMCSLCNEEVDVCPDGKLLTPIEELDLSVRSFNCLKRTNINTVADLISRTGTELMRARGMSEKSLVEIREKLQNIGLYLAGENL